MGLNTLFIGHRVNVLDKVDSTNVYIHDLLAKAPLDEGLIVWALEQYAGKGQRGSSWLSQPGANLTFSVLLRPHFLAIKDQFWLTKALALSVAEFVSDSLGAGPDVKIKWPNDIYVNERKIAGILIENILEKSLIKYSIAGIGVNINQDAFDPSLPNASSLKLLAGKEFELRACLEKLCVSIEKFYLELRTSDYRKIDESYHKLLYRKDIWSKFSLNGKPTEGMIKGVSASGHLLINTKTGAEIQSNEALEVSDVKHLVFL
jgi:BirA family biotin operon repressor/biotin-[acetyl-CoA-carboxylase] ligase